jgi:serine phosphatase RsbU (regulator of sigma subunit)
MSELQIKRLREEIRGLAEKMNVIMRTATDRGEARTSDELAEWNNLDAAAKLKQGELRALERTREIMQSTADILEAPGVPLGIAKDQRFGTAAVENVRGGDLVLVASDGAWEVRNPGGEQLGTEALLRQAAAIRGLPPDEQVARLFEFITDFADGRPLDDDCTIVIARFD